MGLYRRKQVLPPVPGRLSVASSSRKENMTDETVVTMYKCSACDAEVSSEGTEALDHMVNEHGIDPEGGPGQENQPYLIPLDSNPT